MVQLMNGNFITRQALVKSELILLFSKRARNVRQDLFPCCYPGFTLQPCTFGDVDVTNQSTISSYYARPLVKLESCLPLHRITNIKCETSISLHFVSLHFIPSNLTSTPLIKHLNQQTISIQWHLPPKTQSPSQQNASAKPTFSPPMFRSHSSLSKFRRVIARVVDI